MPLKTLLVWSALAAAAYAQEPQTPDDNAEPTAEQVALGRCLFFEPLLSTTGRVSCATCHEPARGYTDAGPVSTGVNGLQGIRRAQTPLNAVYKRALFHDGRALFLEGQCTQPLQAAAEMGNQTLGQAFGRPARLPGYQDMFIKAYGHEVNVSDGVKAIAAFERTLVSGRAPIDRYADGETWVFDKQQERGRYIFFYEHCDRCHNGKNWTDGEFHNILGRTADRNGNLDIGRGKITKRRADNFKFVTPTLRDIGRRAPYFHAGQAATMRDLVEILDNPPQGSELGRMGLSNDDKAALTAFLAGTDRRHPGAFESENYPLVTAPALPAR